MNALLEQFPSWSPSQTQPLQKPLTIAVAGNPNAGKTSLFNALTGLRQKVANYPGVTVERKEGLWSLAPDSPAARVIDLPGLYSLEATSVDEQIARDVLLGREANIAQPDVVIVAVDTTNLVRNLYLFTQLMETGCRLVVALTMFDLAERSNLKINVEKLSKGLGVPVVPVMARQRRGIDRLAEAVLKVAAETSDPQPTLSNGSANHLQRWQTEATSSQPSAAKNNARPRPLFSSDLVVTSAQTWQARLIDRYRWIENVVAGAVFAETVRKHRATERIDALVTHRIAGPVILFLVMLLVFQTIFSWANLPMNLIDRVFNVLGDIVRAHLPAGMLTDLIVSGIIPGVGGVLMFLPQIVLLFFFITVLEDSGCLCGSGNYGYAHHRESEGSRGYNHDRTIHELFGALARLYIDDRRVFLRPKSHRLYLTRCAHYSRDVLARNRRCGDCRLGSQTHFT